MVEWMMLGGMGVGSSLFSYNRENFFFDKEQVLKRVYKGQDFNIKQFQLYREDVRDLVGLTVAKMDNYLVVNTLMLTFTVILFTEGKPEPLVWPQHLQWLYSLCNVGAFMYFLMSVWLAMHASIAAHSFGVRLLTQFVRLPVPSDEQLDAARARAQDYEGNKGREIFRIPILKQQMKKLNKVMDRDTTEDEASVADAGSDSGSNCGDHPSPLAMQRHVQLFRELQTNWQSYDAYSRVCMTMGINQFLHACGYYAVGILTAENLAPFAAFSCIVMLTVASWLVMRLDLYLSKRFLAVAAFLITAPPLLSLVDVAVEISIASGSFKDKCKLLLPVAFLLHVVWIIFIIRISKADFLNGAALPKQFRAVTYLDVFGWISQSRAAEEGNVQPQDEPGTVATLDTELEDSARSSSMAGSLSLRSSQRRSLAPPDLRGSLIQTCAKEQRKLSVELGRWENKTVEDFLFENLNMQQEIIQVREKLHRLVLRFDAAKGDYQLEPNPSSLASFDQSEIKVWLKLEYNAAERAMDYYYCVEDDATKWEQPQEPGNRISEVWLLEKQLDTFSEKVDALIAMNEDEVMQNTESVLQEEVHTDEAGRVTSVPFFPQGPTGRSNEASTRRPPGQMPWRTFLQGSLCLVAIWLVGFLWCSLHVVGIDLPIMAHNNTKNNTNATAATLPLQLVYKGQWPHALFSPRSLACHSSTGPVLFVAEKYAVHQLRVSESQLSQIEESGLPSAMLSDCLRQAPDFHFGGIHEISIDCSRENLCSVLLFGASGQGALRCPISDGQGTDVVVHGKQWRGLIASAENGHFWALGSSSLVMMRQLNRTYSEVSKEEVVPKFEIKNDVLHDALKVHNFVDADSGSEVILTLHPLGRLQVWSMKENRNPDTWHFLAHSVNRWTGMCTIGRTLYVAGVSHDGMLASVWRTNLPDDLNRGV